MPLLVPDFTVGISTDRVTLTLIDETVYPDREALRVFVTLFKVTFQNVATEIELTPDDVNPAYVVEWAGAYGIDGFYKWLWAAFPEYDVATSYDTYDAIFDPNTDYIYRSLVDDNLGNDVSDTDFWELIEDPSSLALNKDTDEESLNIDSTVYNRVLTFHSQNGYANLVSDQSTCTDCDTEEVLKTISDFDTLLTGALIADNRQEVTDGEIICRKIQSTYL
jgi:hypothetical protein